MSARTPDASRPARGGLRAAQVGGRRQGRELSPPSIVGAGKPFAVTAPTAAPIGEVTPDAVIDLLAGVDESRGGAHDVAASPIRRAPRPAISALAVDLDRALVAPSLVLYLSRGTRPGPSNYPDGAIIPFADWISAVMAWLKTNFTWLTRVITGIFNVPLQLCLRPAGQGLQVRLRPRCHRAAAPVLGRRRGAACDRRLRLGGMAAGAAGAACFLYIALFGQWTAPC